MRGILEWLNSDRHEGNFPLRLAMLLRQHLFTGRGAPGHSINRGKIMKSLIAMLAGLLLATVCWAGQQVNINTATAEELAEALDGVGLSKAEAIIEYRNANGPFEHADELVNVKGIGLSTVDRNRGYILLKGQKKVAAQGS
jgi:competence protein ComEA